MRPHPVILRLLERKPKECPVSSQRPIEEASNQSPPIGPEEASNQPLHIGPEQSSNQLLPIYQHRDEILAKIQQHPVTIICGSTGCGKSTCVPQFCLEAFESEQKPCNILVTQPRRIAARSLARYVASSRNCLLGTQVGYQVGMDQKVGPDTVIQYVTTGVLLERLVGNIPLARYTHVIVDECHERDTDMDLVFYFIRQSLIDRAPTKVILMSATAKTQKLQSYFEYHSPCVINIKQHMFEVKPHFVEDLFSVGILNYSERNELATAASGRGGLSDELADEDDDDDMDDLGDGLKRKCTPFMNTSKKELIYRILCRIQKQEMEEQRATSLDEMNCGTVLVFLPGMWEILDMASFLREFRPPRGDVRYAVAIETNMSQSSWQIIPLHSQLNADDEVLIFGKPQKGRRKILLSTNIAESSITIPDVKYVVDLAMTKQLELNTNTKFTVLHTTWASQSSCIQRRGRAGRVQAGEYYCLITKEDFHELPPEDVPETLRIPLENVVLKVKKAQLDPHVALEKLIDPPNSSRITQCIHNLAEIGAIIIQRSLTSVLPSVRVVRPRVENFFYRNGAQEEADDNGGIGHMISDSLQCGGRLNMIGQLMCVLPLDLHASKLIALGFCLGVMDECVIIACAMCATRSIFISPVSRVEKDMNTRRPYQQNNVAAKKENLARKHAEAYENKLRFSGRANSDSIALLNAYCTWEQAKHAGMFRTASQEALWCQQRYLDLRSLREVETRVLEVRARLAGEFFIPLGDAKDVRGFGNFRGSAATTGVEDDHRLFFIYLALCGAFYPNYFLRDFHSTREEEAGRELLSHDPRRSVNVRGLPQGKGAAYMQELSNWFSINCVPGSSRLRQYGLGPSPSGDGVSSQCQVVPYETQAVIVFPDSNNGEVEQRVEDLPRGAALPVYLAMHLGRLFLVKPPLKRLTSNVPLAVSNEMDAVSKLTHGSLWLLQSHLDVPVEVIRNHIGFPSDDVSFVDISVLLVGEVGVVYGVYAEHMKLWHELQQNLRDLEEMLQPLPLDAPLHVGMLCVVAGHRVRVLAADEASNAIQVLFVDRGDIRHVSRHHLLNFEGVTEMSAIPDLGVRVVLANVRPSAVNHASGGWKPEDKVKFCQLLNVPVDACENEGSEMGTVRCEVYSIVGRELRVYMYATDVTPPFSHDVSFNVKLTQMFIAESAIESAASLANHDQRQKMHSYYGKKTNVAFCLQNSFAKLSDTPSVHSTKEIQERVDELSRLVRDAKIFGDPHRSMLRGPFHPYVMGFVGTCKNSKGKQVEIAKDSVNSVVIDEYPQDHTDRLLIAGVVQQSQRNPNNILLRHTTLLPPIHGLPMLAALIFSPSAELRVTLNERTAYQGAVLGLGYDETWQVPSEDTHMELVADVLLDARDLSTVNDIRTAISILCDPILHGGSGQKISTAKKCLRDDLIRLFQMPRKLVLPQDPDKRYEWRKIPSDCLVSPLPEHHEIGLTYLPHCHVSGVLSDTERYIRSGTEDDVHDNDEEVADFRVRHARRLQRLAHELGVMANRKAISSRSNNILAKVAVCEICDVAVKDRQQLIGHLDSLPHKELVGSFK